MTHTANFQKHLSECILSEQNHKALAKWFTDYSEEELAARLVIYKNNVFYSLIEALKDLYPTVVTTIGEGLFSIASRNYIQDHPPTSSAMVELGQDFPAYLRTFDRTRSIAYLEDLARLDLSRHQSYHERDVHPLSADDFASITAEEIAQSCIEVIPSTRLIESQYAVYSIWNLAQGKTQEKHIHAEIPERVLIVRPKMNVEMYLLNQGTYMFFKTLFASKSISDAIDTTLSNFADFRPSEAFTFLIQCGIVAKLTRGKKYENNIHYRQLRIQSWQRFSRLVYCLSDARCNVYSFLAVGTNQN